MQLPKAATTVPPTHNISAPYVGVGEQPGRTEVKRRQVFIGPAGRELDEDLIAADISRPQIYLTNVIKDLDRPIDHYIQMYRNNKKLFEPIISEKGLEYIKFLQWELSQTSAKYFLAIGGTALYILTGRIGINKWRGSVLDCTLVPGRKVIAILHPATVIPPKNQYLNKRLIIFDLKRLREYTDDLHIASPYDITASPGYLETLKFLNFCKQSGMAGARISYDIEVFMNRKHKQVSCIAFATKGRGICIPFVDSRGDYFNIEQETEIWLHIADILEHPNIKICGQNLVFDSHFLLRTYGIQTSNMDDTMIAQNQIMPDYPKGLDFITSIWTDHPYYKADGKAFFKGSGQYEKFWQYNATDALICDEAFPKQFEEISSLNTIDSYKRQVSIIEPLVYMMEKGLKVDIVGMEQVYNDYEQKIVDLQEQLDTLVGHHLNAKSPKQLREYFFHEKGIKPFKHKGKISYNNDAMKRLVRKGWEEAEIIQDIRRFTKLRSTYLDVGKMDEDGRIRCSYNPAGTKFSRISSSKNIWGSGGNFQNYPHDVQNFLIPDEGYAYYAFDLGQAENRIVAYVGEVIDMIECFETGTDVHSKTARMIMQTFYGTNPSTKISVKDLSPIGRGDKTWRSFGKTANHCVFSDTDVLSKGGWISVTDAAFTNCKIACFSEIGNHITFEEPSNWFVEDYLGDVVSFKGRYLSQRVTPGHRIPYRERMVDINNPLKWETAQDKRMISSNEWPLAGIYEGGTINIPNLYIRLMVAFQADGGWDWKAPLWHMRNRTKIARLLLILNLLKVDYTIRKSIEKKKEYTLIYIKAHNMERDFLRKMFAKNKKWDYWLLDMDRKSLDVFCDEIVRWDGDRKCYWTSIKENAELVQTIFHLSGFKSSIGWGCKATGTYIVSKITKPETRCDIISKNIEKTSSTRIFCPTVSTGAFMVRHKDIISVTGNSFNYDFGYRNFALRNELQENEGKLIYDSYHKLYPGVKQSFHTYVKNCLRTSRVLTNLMGRRTVFLGPITGSNAIETFKQAYSCIPQGTVGDIINERGLCYIYNNQDLFGPIELLRQVHDEIGFQIPLNIGWKKHADMLLLIKKSLETPLTTHNGRTFVIPADLVIGKHMNKDEGYEVDSTKDLATEIQQGWEKINA